MPRLLALLACLALIPTARAAALDPHLPADTESYVNVNVKQILDSPVVKKIGVDRLKGWLKDLEGVDALLKELGFDPFKDLDRVQIASPRTTETDRGLMILTGTFDKAKLEKKADESARDNEDNFKLHKVPLGDKETHAVYEVKVSGQNLTLFVALVENKTLLASPGKDYVVDALKQARAKKKPALKNKEFQAVVEKLDTRQGVSLALRGAAVGTSDLLDLLPRRLRDGLDRVESIGGGIGFTNDIKLDLVGSARSDDDAKLLRDATFRGVRFAQGSLGFLGNENKLVVLLGDLLNSVKVGGKGKVVSLSAKLTADMLDDFFKDEG
jgi:hypothetical protein